MNFAQRKETVLLVAPFTGRPYSVSFLFRVLGLLFRGRMKDQQHGNLLCRSSCRSEMIASVPETPCGGKYVFPIYLRLCSVVSSYRRYRGLRAPWWGTRCCSNGSFSVFWFLSLLRLSLLRNSSSDPYGHLAPSLFEDRPTFDFGNGPRLYARASGASVDRRSFSWFSSFYTPHRHNTVRHIPPAQRTFHIFPSSGGINLTFANAKSPSAPQYLQPFRMIQSPFNVLSALLCSLFQLYCPGLFSRRPSNAFPGQQIVYPTCPPMGVRWVHASTAQ